MRKTFYYYKTSDTQFINFLLTLFAFSPYSNKTFFSMRKTFLRIGSLLAALAVISGAFGAHALRGKLTLEQLATYETAVQYHFFHTFAILLVSMLLRFRNNIFLLYAGWFFAGGILIFSGSLYGLSIGSAANLPVGPLGRITPIGGLLFILGWVAILVSSYSGTDKTRSEDN